MNEYEVQHNEYLISCDPSKLNLQSIHAYLSTSYWSPEIPIETVKRAIENSLCFSILRLEQQVGFARVVTDRATFAYLCDVYVLEEHRGRGLSKYLMQAVLRHPQLQGLRRFLLATRDAHGLYKQFDFKELIKPDSFLEIYRPDIYQEVRDL